MLSEHVQEFRDLFDRAHIGMATLTANGTIIRANQALAGLMSCVPQDLVGVDYGQLAMGKGEELDRLLEDICSLGEDLTSFEHYLPPPAGEEPERIVSVTLAPIRDSHRQVLYMFAQVHDVTAHRTMERSLRESEENLRRLVTAVTEYAIYMLDVEGNVISWNSGAARIKGYAAHEIVGQPFRRFYPLEDRASGRPERNLEAALRQGGFTDEGWRVRKDGSRFWASVVISPVYDEQRHHVGFAKVTRDQTQQRAHEEERLELLDQRIHLLAVTAHELRTPTAVIDGSAGALESTWEQMSTDERAEMLGNIRAGADRLRRLAEDLTTAAQSDGGTLPLRLEEVSLTQTLRSVRDPHPGHPSGRQHRGRRPARGNSASRPGAAGPSARQPPRQRVAPRCPTDLSHRHRHRAGTHPGHRRRAGSPGGTRPGSLRPVRQGRSPPGHGPRALSGAADRSRARR